MLRVLHGLSNTIRKRFILLFLSTTLLTSTVSLYIFFTYANLTENMGSMFATSTMLDGMLTDLDTANTNLYSFLESRNNDNLLNFSKMADRLQLFSDEAHTNQPTDLYLEDIARMIPSYLAEARLAIDTRRARDPAYISHYDLANKTMGYIRSYSDALNIRQLQKNTTLYQNQSRYMGWLKTASIVMIADLIILSVLLVLYMTYKMTDPILKLARASEEISKGNFDTPEIPVTGEEELRVMAQAFNGMKNSIRTYIREIHDQSETESLLMEQQMQNMKMQNLLDSSRLQALQAQINPHFLFNTLNAGVQLSMMEGADRTTEFLGNLSDLFRYNIQNPDAIVTLQDEVSHVRAYTELMKVRFGTSIQFLFDIDEAALSVGIPPLSIQTIVENACIHGLGNKESGMIRIRISESTTLVTISISDNGSGMEADIIHDIYKRTDEMLSDIPGKKSGHTTGIGLVNVIQRLRIFTGQTNALEILSESGVGTTVTIRLKRDRVASDDNALLV